MIRALLVVLLGVSVGALVQAKAQAPARVAPWAEDPFPSTYHAPDAPPVLIVHATVLDGAGHRLDDGEVLLRGGKVAAVGHHLATEGARVIDAHGRWVTPGIIDIHTHDGTYHLPQTAVDAEASDVAELSDPNAAGTWIETAVRPDDPAFGAALASGVTTLQILPARHRCSAAARWSFIPSRR